MNSDIRTRSQRMKDLRSIKAKPLTLKEKIIYTVITSYAFFMLAMTISIWLGVNELVSA